MRDFSPGPMLMRKTVRASMARMPRKSRVSAPGTLAAVQVAPPSVVRRKVPAVPLAQTTWASTAEMPRSPAVVLVVWRVQDWAKAVAVRRVIGARRIGFMLDHAGVLWMVSFLAAVIKSVYRLLGIGPPLFILSLCFSAGLQGQSEMRRQFEVASVKPCDPKTPRPFISNSPSRFVATNVPLILYIGTAYGVRTEFIKGLPESMAEACYDITANASDPGDHWPAGTMRHWAEMQMLLEERFKLQFRRETQVVPVLKLLRGKGELKMQKSERVPPAGPLVTSTPGKLEFVGISMANLALQLYRRMGGPNSLSSMRRA